MYVNTYTVIDFMQKTLCVAIYNYITITHFDWHPLTFSSLQLELVWYFCVVVNSLMPLLHYSQECWLCGLSDVLSPAVPTTLHCAWTILNPSSLCSSTYRLKFRWCRLVAHALPIDWQFYANMAAVLLAHIMHKQSREANYRSLMLRKFSDKQVFIVSYWTKLNVDYINRIIKAVFDLAKSDLD